MDIIAHAIENMRRFPDFKMWNDGNQFIIEAGGARYDGTYVATVMEAVINAWIHIEAAERAKYMVKND